MSFSRLKKNLHKAHEHFITSTMSKPNDFQNHHTPNELDPVCDDRNDRANNYVGNISLGRKRWQLSNILLDIIPPNRILICLMIC